MTALDLGSDRPSAASPTLWAGRTLSAVMGVFLSVEGVARLLLGRSLVSEVPASGLEPAVGTALTAGAALLAFTPTRRVGAGLLTLVLIGLAAVEARIANPSPDHLLFWLYVATLVVAGSLLRSTRPQV